MRKPERIKDVLHKLGVIWMKSPDLRFFQLLTSLGLQDGDMFYLEDDELERHLNKHINRLYGKKMSW